MMRKILYTGIAVFAVFVLFTWPDPDTPKVNDLIDVTEETWDPLKNWNTELITPEPEQIEIISTVKKQVLGGKSMIVVEDRVR